MVFYLNILPFITGNKYTVHNTMDTLLTYFIFFPTCQMRLVRFDYNTVLPPYLPPPSRQVEV